MKKNTFLLALMTVCLTVSAQQSSDPKKVWSDIIEIEQGILQRHVIHDIPGSIIVLIPDGQGKFKSRLIGKKVLKDINKLPELKSKPTDLVSDIVKQELALNLSYLSFASVNMSTDEEIRFSITETSNCSILDNEIDWQTFNERVATIKSNNSNLPAGTIFAVCKVASVITIDNQRFKKVTKAGDISGWGFSSSNKYLTESSNRRVDFKVGVAITFSDEFLDFLIAKSTDNKLNKNWKSNDKVFNKIQALADLNRSIKELVVGEAKEIFGSKIEE